MVGTVDPTSDFLTIKTGGQTLEGWMDTTVSRGVELCPSHYTIELTERYPTSETQAIVLPGNSCEVYLGQDLILTGYIDEYSPSYDGYSHNVRISGRSKTEDAVDTSYWPAGTETGSEKQGSWSIRPQPLSQAVKQILEQLPQVNLNFQGTDPQIPSPGIDITPGESVYSVIETLCRLCSKLLWDDEKGNLVIGDVGTKNAGSPLVEGTNVLAAATRYNWVQRYKQLYIVSSGVLPGTNIAFPVLAKSYVDDQVGGTGRERLKVIPLDSFAGGDKDFFQRLADWHQSRCIGRSLMIEAHVVGWRDGKGVLWTPNTLVKVQLPQQKIESTLIISECEWRRSSNGTITRMTLMPSGGLQPAPFQPKVFVGTTGQPS